MPIHPEARVFFFAVPTIVLLTCEGGFRWLLWGRKPDDIPSFQNVMTLEILEVGQQTAIG